MHFIYQTGEPGTPDRCYCIESLRPLEPHELNRLKKLFSTSYAPERTTLELAPISEHATIIGPRISVETANSSSATFICQRIGLPITRVEEFIIYTGVPKDEITHLYDRMTQSVYPHIPHSFVADVNIPLMQVVPLLENGPAALMEINSRLGLGMDADDLKHYFNLFVHTFGRNPTDLECFQLGQANSEHSRHWFFKGCIFIGGHEMPLSLMELIQKPLQLLGTDTNSVIAFSDDSSAIGGYTVLTLQPKNPGRSSIFQRVHKNLAIVLTAETHNHPTKISPYGGAETGVGGRQRDNQAVGRGGLLYAGTAGYCVGNIWIDGYDIPGQDKAFTYNKSYATPLQILIEGSDGAAAYGNKSGEPIINGFTRTAGLVHPSKGRIEFLKPVFFTAGLGAMDMEHIHKGEAEPGMLIVQIGGPAYRVGFGGGAASSMTNGENTDELDFNSVQRGNPEMAQRVFRVIRTCIELGLDNPIISIHDQGAGGPCNVITELVEKTGGRVDIRNITVGDVTMSALELWGAEYQERQALLIRPGADGYDLFKAICDREGVPCDLLGQVTDDKYITLYDSQVDQDLVHLYLPEILGNLPRKEFHFEEPNDLLKPFILPHNNHRIADLVMQIFRLPSVGSKGFLVHKKDRSVTGLVAQQQCCGPTQIPIANLGAMSLSYLSRNGMATANGEQPLKLMVDPRAGARMSFGEMLTNMVWIVGEGLENIKCSANWMWAAKRGTEGASLYYAAEALINLVIAVRGGEPDGGKDSLSMVAKIDETLVESPRQLVISGYSPVPDVMKKVTPDLKRVGSQIGFIDLSGGNTRMGGSALAQSFGQLGDTCPDVDADLLRNAFNAMQELIKGDYILAGHDKSDGGIVTTLIEMALAGNVGIKIYLKGDIVSTLFNEELGMVFEYNEEDLGDIELILKKHSVFECFSRIGKTMVAESVNIYIDSEIVLNEKLTTLRRWWEQTSDKIEEIQTNGHNKRSNMSLDMTRQSIPPLHLTFVPEKTSTKVLEREQKPRIAILRTTGSNGDREMNAAFEAVGFEVQDVLMEDLLTKDMDLSSFDMSAFVGGFSHADVLGSGKGWATIINEHEKLRKVFGDFYSRTNTLSFGSCNGFQLMTHLGWIPGTHIPEHRQPRLTHNQSGKFESRWSYVQIQESPAIMLKGMAGSTLGIWVAHGEGQLFFPDDKVFDHMSTDNLMPVRFVNTSGVTTGNYPENPNGSILGITGICSPDGRHFALMPHPERCFLPQQLPHNPYDDKFDVAPWMKIFQNAYEWCMENK